MKTVKVLHKSHSGCGEVRTKERTLNGTPSGQTEKEKVKVSVSGKWEDLYKKEAYFLALLGSRTGMLSLVEAVGTGGSSRATETGTTS